MARTRIKCIFIFSLIVSVFTRSLPLTRESTSSTSPVLIKDEVYISPDKDVLEDITILNTSKEITEKNISDHNATNRNVNRNEVSSINNIRPGQIVRSYAIEFTREDDVITAIASIEVRLTDLSMGEMLVFYVAGLEIENIQVSVASTDNFQDAYNHIVDDIFLEIFPSQGLASTYIVDIHYTVPLRNDGTGIYLGGWDDNEYIAMNLHSTNARRVFPCMDEPNMSSSVSFTFRNMDNFQRIISNSQFDGESTTTLKTLNGPVHRWSMVAHSLNHVNTPVMGLVFLYARPGAEHQENYAATAINHFYNALNEWAGREHANLIADQNGGLHIMAMPDVARDWYGLSTLCIWEPYILMENNAAVKQRKTALVTIAEGIARQWFGHTIFPENWRDQWVISGLASYAAYEVAKDFQTPPEGREDDSLIDMHAIFTTDVIQESLLYDAYASAKPLRAENNLFEEHAIRLHTLGLLKMKAPALLTMIKLVLSDERDLVQSAAQGLINGRTNEWVASRSLIDGLQGGYISGVGSGLIESVVDFVQPWIDNVGYPLITVSIRRNSIQLTQERFGFTRRQDVVFEVPLSFTTSLNPNFDNIVPTVMLHTNINLNINLPDEDWIIFNLQGQGYYRVHYDDSWHRLVEVLADPETRDDIHPLNRASLLDDALILARGGKLDYDTALEIALSMELETEYAPWKAFVRNMDFIRKHLIPFVQTEDEERGEDIYLRMVRRTIVALEEEIGFEPEVAEPAMVSLTRGLVMEHACKADYAPCVAAAVDIFYDPDDEDQVNPDIPPEIRPAVYCTMMMKEEEEEVREALEDRLAETQSRYERLVILESLACSEDERFLDSLLLATVNADNPYNLVLEERSKVFAAVASASFLSSQRALLFLIMNVPQIRDAYGGPEKLEEVIFIMAENIVHGDQAGQFNTWINSQNSLSRLDDSIDAANLASVRIAENMAWNENNLEAIYDWIDVNDASTVFVSSILICVSVFVALLN